MGSREPKWRIGWNWLWFGPVCLVLLYFVEIHTMRLGLMTIRLAIKRWSWVGLFSPSAYFYLSTVLFSVSFPFRALLFAMGSLANDQLTTKHRGVLTAIAIAGVILLPFVTDTLIWGSFPFQFDDAGIGRLRLIPFLPWPSGGYMTF
jgi:hypothetical protein